MINTWRQAFKEMSNRVRFWYADSVADICDLPEWLGADVHSFCRHRRMSANLYNLICDWGEGEEILAEYADK